ncbi:MAG: hypothetical protein IBJ04_12295 [Hydrogenophaga sp.]|uniref:hypothetical protein n=1 Tax=Hydrogenophaga sp. TaxID=1904254 RepID=UPI00258113DA|nr:hypothetical protein [Hydrogenophaga sp.]MBL0945101.1 hypothetical protein [Hydrogenophaga sp.]
MPSKTKTAPRKTAKPEQTPGPKAGQRQIGATELPRKTLEECLTVAKPVYEVYAGKSASWDEIATTAGIGTKTTNTKYLIWGAQAYDLLVKDGDNLALSETGRKFFAPNYPEERQEALLKAITIPTILSKFYSEYNGKLLPDGDFLDNVLENRFDIPRDRVDEAKQIILANAQFAGIITSHPNGKRTIRLDASPRAELQESDEALTRQQRGTIEAVEDLATHRPVLSPESVCFYITPIGDEGSEVRRHADMLLRHLIEPAFETFGMKVVRADRIEKSGLISQQIFEHIVSAKFCVADLSFGNPNAFYELGVRHMTKLPTIQLIRKGDKIPFDVSQGRTITVDMSDIYTIMDRMESARKELVEHIRNYLDPAEKSRSDDNPVSVYLPGLQVRLPKSSE